MNPRLLSLRFAGTLLAAAALAGCGGGGGSPVAFFPSVPPATGTGTTSPPTTTAPGTSTPQASAYDQFLAYVVALVANPQDTIEPADVAAFDPAPTSETAEPTATP